MFTLLRSWSPRPNPTPGSGAARTSAGSAFDAAVGDYGAILDVTMRPRDRGEILHILAPQWRDWAETETGNALKLQTRVGGRTIDAVVKLFTVSMQVLILQPDNITSVKRIMEPFWRYDHYERGHYAGAMFVARGFSDAGTL